MRLGSLSRIPQSVLHFEFRSPLSVGSERVGQQEKLATLSSACCAAYHFASLEFVRFS